MTDSPHPSLPLPGEVGPGADRLLPESERPLSETGPSPETAQSGAHRQPLDWKGELRGLLMMLVAVIAFHSLIAKPFYIPSASMAPNLWVGDRLVVAKYPYGWNWASASFHLAPRGPWRIWPRDPEYGDVVIVVPRGSTSDYIKRVVALPGDRIAVVNGQIVLNGKPVPQAVEPPLALPLDALRSPEDPDPCTGWGYDGMLAREGSGRVTCELPILRETLPNGATYRVIDHMDQAYDHMPEIKVPAGHVFLMGDNRDASADSRVSLADRGLGGPVPLSDIGGRAEFTTFSLDGSESLNPASWWRALRGARAWLTLRPPLDQSGKHS